MMTRHGIEAQPLITVSWVPREQLRANSYNPNRVFKPELDLLKLSILEDGWTQPIVARPDGEIIDGFHRWTVAGDPAVAKMTDGKVPVVFLSTPADTDQRISTIRHNRARGHHGVVRMSQIVLDLLASGLSREEIERRLQMDEEELDRLSDVRSSPESAGRESFGQGWVPDESGA